MPDIQLRFQKDMLVLSAPLDAMLARQGVSLARDRQYLNLMEPDSIIDALKLEKMAGAQCLVATTEDITQARLAHVGMDADALRLARAALAAANEVRPQHLLVEVGPCGLPLDPSSKASLNENRAQYANAAKAFEGSEFDAFFLNGFSRVLDLKCALMGLAQVSDKPVFASVTLGEGGADDAAGGQKGSALGPSGSGARRSAAEGGLGAEPEGAVPNSPFEGYAALDAPTPPPLPAARRSPMDPALWPEALDAMIDLGASVVGFETADLLDRALDYTRVAVARTDLPVLAQLCVTGFGDSARSGLVPLADIDEYTPDTMAPAAVKLYGAGAQFLRATGLATPAYTGALAATVMGLDVRR